MIETLPRHQPPPLLAWVLDPSVAASCQDTKLLQATITTATGADGGTGQILHNGDTEHDLMRMKFAAPGHAQPVEISLADKDGNALMVAGTTQTGKDFWASVDVFGLKDDFFDGARQIQSAEKLKGAALNLETSQTITSDNTNLIKIVVHRPDNGSTTTVGGTVTVKVAAPGFGNGFGNAVLWQPTGNGTALSQLPAGLSVGAPTQALGWKYLEAKFGYGRAIEQVAGKWRFRTQAPGTFLGQDFITKTRTGLNAAGWRTPRNRL